MDVFEIVNNALRSLCAWLCEFIYTGIAKLYQIFMEIGQLIYVDELTVIYNKVSLVIGIFMVFRITFWLIELLITPEGDSYNQKSPGKIIQKVMLVVVLLGVTPSIFQWAYDIQYKIISKNIIGNIINVDNTSTDASDAGKLMATSLFFDFFELNIQEGEDETTNECSGSYNSYKHVLSTYGELKGLNEDSCITDKNSNGQYYIEFNGLFAVGVGIFIFWMVLMYCISIGTRYIQMVYLQVIAPIPIMCYLTPKKDSMFSKWLKQCTTTYLDLFIRVAIIEFVLLLINIILGGDFTILDVVSSENKTWIEILLVLGLLTFAKKAPDLIQELLPKSVTKASGDFGLSWKKRTESMLGGKMIYGATRTATKAATAGVATGAVTGAIGFLGGRGTGRITGLLGGTLRGFGSGTRKGPALDNLGRSIKHQNEVNKRKIDWANNGSRLGGRTEQRLANALGYAGPAEQFENRMSEIDTAISQNRSRIAEKKRQVNAYQQISDAKSKAEDRAENKLLTDTFATNDNRYALQQKVLQAKNAVEVAKQNGSSASTIAQLEANYNATLKQAKKDYITGVLNGSINDASMSSTFDHVNNIIADSITKGEDTFKGFKRKSDSKDINGTNVKFSNYEDLDDFEGTTTTKKNELNEGTTDANGKRIPGILGIEEQNQELENEKAEIQASDEYKKAKANRDAVGGHHGK